jgi:hypothetical protein
MVRCSAEPFHFRPESSGGAAEDEGPRMRFITKRPELKSTRQKLNLSEAPLLASIIGNIT